MATIILSIPYCGDWESDIRDAIWEMPGEEDVGVEVQEHRVVVRGVNNASSEELMRHICDKVGLRAVEEQEEEQGLRAVSEDNDDGDSDDDDSDSDSDDDDSNSDDDDDDHGNDDAYLLMASLALHPDEPLGEGEQPYADPTPLFQQYFIF